MGKLINFQEAVAAKRRGKGIVPPKAINGALREVLRGSLSALEDEIAGEKYDKLPVLLQDMKLLYRLTLKILETPGEGVG
jgi:hypothetical protein